MSRKELFNSNIPNDTQIEGINGEVIGPFDSNNNSPKANIAKRAFNKLPMGARRTIVGVAATWIAFLPLGNIAEAAEVTPRTSYNAYYNVEEFAGNGDSIEGGYTGEEPDDTEGWRPEEKDPDQPETDEKPETGNKVQGPGPSVPHAPNLPQTGGGIESGLDGATVAIAGGIATLTIAGVAYSLDKMAKAKKRRD